MRRVSIIKLLVGAVKAFISDNVMALSAALSFYTLLSFAPLMVLAIWASSFLGFDAEQTLISQIGLLAGEGAGTTAEAVIESAESQPSVGTLAGVFGILVTLAGASTVFAQLQSSLNAIWGIESRPGKAIWVWFRHRIFSVGLIAALGFILIVSLVISAAFGLFLPQSGMIWEIANIVISAILYTALFALIFRYLPDSRLPWWWTVRGAVVTSVLFTAGKSLIGLYLASGNVGGAYGAAGSVIILMVWVYYSSAIFFFGAEFVQTWVNARGEKIPLTENAVRSEQAPPGRRAVRTA